MGEIRRREIAVGNIPFRIRRKEIQGKGKEGKQQTHFDNGDVNYFNLKEGDLLQKIVKVKININPVAKTAGFFCLFYYK